MKRGKGVRGTPALDRGGQLEFRRYREAGVTHNECCSLFGISRATGFRLMAKLRAELGPEKLRNGHFARHQLRPAAPTTSAGNSN